MRTSVVGRYASVTGAVGALWAVGYVRVPLESRGEWPGDRWPQNSRTFESEFVGPHAVEVKPDGDGWLVEPCAWIPPRSNREAA